MDRDPLDDRPLTQPLESRLPSDAVARAAVLEAHAAALARGEALYADPATGLFVLTAGYLADRGYCCGRGCRHCPYARDPNSTDSSEATGVST